MQANFTHGGRPVQDLYLAHHYYRSEKKIIPERLIRKWALQLASALQFLHTASVPDPTQARAPGRSRPASPAPPLHPTHWLPTAAATAKFRQ